MLRLIRSAQSQWRAFAVFWLIVAAMTTVVAGELARREAGSEALARSATATALHAAVLRSELERHRSLPLVLAQDPDLKSLLTAPAPAAVDRINRKLEDLARETRASVIYVLDPRGLAVVASNWRQPTSFVGSDYSFRPYYTEAMRDGQASFFALGIVSGKPGLFLSRRIEDNAGRPLGVIVAKLEFDALETEWRSSGEPTYVTDRDGVVLITTIDRWRFHTTAALDADRRHRLAVDQTGGHAELSRLPFEALRPGLIRLSHAVPPDLYARTSTSIPDTDWRLHLLFPAGAGMARAVMAARLVALLSVALLAGLTGILLRRRQHARARADQAEAARIDLERQVGARTAELRETNDQLNLEIEERRRLEKSRQDLQDDLIQANKLATLGQIAAGVAHEINQPLAAIRTYADSAAIYLQRHDPDAVGLSLTRIGELTQRVGVITDELRAFSRKTRSGTVAVGVDAAIDGALLLVAARLRERNIVLTRTRGPDGLEVLAERNRLEQVVLNLLQNAIEALGGVDQPTLEISVTIWGAVVAVSVSDNGPGVSAEVIDRLFTPFTTSKRDGMGLGLVISRDIVTGFGGELIHEPSPVGAVFKIVLAKAK